jgi:Xaa-Pro aminopeptidase
VFKARREQFMKAMGKGVAVFPAAPPRTRSNDTEYEYRQNSDFHYLTGFDEPESVAVVTTLHPEHRFVLFVRPRDKEKEIWNGRRAGPDGAKSKHGADEAYTIDSLDEMLPRYVENAPRLFYRLGLDREFDDRMTGILNRIRAAARTGVTAPAEIVDPATIVHEMRLIKNDDDLSRLRRACEISAEAHVAAMRACRPGMNECELEAIVEYVFRRSGAASPGYSSIVGAGANATILHYIENNAPIRDGDLVLIDAACEYLAYSSDITRTFPANGRFSRPQKALYEIVLKAQLEAIDEVRPGAPFQAYHERAVRVLVEGLIGLGLLDGTAEEAVANESYKRYYMHRTGHWLGIDVHDAGRYQIDGASRPLEPGMVMTVEPGIYIAEDDDRAPGEYRGIGIRIEDDVLVTRSGNEVLTSKVPKTIADIEATMALGAPVLL